MSRIDQLLKLVELDPGDPLSHYGVGLERINLEQWDQAAAAFGEAIARDRNYSAAYYHKGRAERLSGRADDARATLMRGLEAARASGDRKTEAEMHDLLDSLD
jgi:tetratricopeptide (TPR) repeat protein